MTTDRKVKITTSLRSLQVAIGATRSKADQLRREARKVEAFLQSTMLRQSEQLEQVAVDLENSLNSMELAD